MSMEVDTGSSGPIRQPPRRTPFAVREVARQLKEMQANGVISPSQSPWASPVMIDGQEEEWHSLILC